MLMQRHDVGLTLNQCLVNVVCLLGLSENPEDRFSCVVVSNNSVACSTTLEQILQVQQIIIFEKIMRKLFIRYVNGCHIIWLSSTSSYTQVIRNYSPQSGGTAGTLIFWFQVPGMTLY